MKKYLHVDGKKLELNEFGSGPKTLLLLSGWTHDFQTEEKFLLELAKQFRVITISWPGYAASEVNPKAQSMKFLASIVQCVITELGLKNVHVVGFSMGCQIALHYVRYFNNNARLILISPPTKSFISEAPLYGKLLLSSHFIISVARAIQPIKKFMVNKAYSEIERVTENSRHKGAFEVKSASYDGAFDTLVALLTSFIDPLTVQSNVGFIFGEKEILQKSLDNKNAIYKTIKGIGHGAFGTHYKELASAVIEVANEIR